jgi:hypothetical protein
MPRHQSRLGVQQYASVPRNSLMLAGSSFPADTEGNNGDYFIVLATNGTTPVIIGPKTDNTWVGANQCAIQNQLAPAITYLQYLGDNAGQGQIALPSNGSGVSGQLCFLLDFNSNCCAVALNTNGVWNILFQDFSIPPTAIYTAGGKPIYIAPVINVPDEGTSN